MNQKTCRGAANPPIQLWNFSKAMQDATWRIGWSRHQLDARKKIMQLLDRRRELEDINRLLARVEISVADQSEMEVLWWDVCGHLSDNADDAALDLTHWWQDSSCAVNEETYIEPFSLCIDRRQIACGHRLNVLPRC